MTPRNDDPRCDHVEDSTQVSNESQKDAYQKDKPLRMARACNRPECILDALAWATRGTHERAWWRPNGGEWRISTDELFVQARRNSSKDVNA